MKLYCDRLKEERLGAGRVGHGTQTLRGARALGAGAWGAGARRCHTAAWGCDMDKVSSTTRRWASHDTATRAQAELWLCTWCTWLVFDSVLFLSH